MDLRGRIPPRRVEGRKVMILIFSRPALARRAIAHPRAFLEGFRNALTSNGVTYSDPSTSLSIAYDLGRDLRKGGAA